MSGETTPPKSVPYLESSSKGTIKLIGTDEKSVVYDLNSNSAPEAGIRVGRIVDSIDSVINRVFQNSIELQVWIDKYNTTFNNWNLRKNDPTLYKFAADGYTDMLSSLILDMITPRMIAAKPFNRLGDREQNYLDSVVKYQKDIVRSTFFSTLDIYNMLTLKRLTDVITPLMMQVIITLDLDSAAALEFQYLTSMNLLKKISEVTFDNYANLIRGNVAIAMGEHTTTNPLPTSWSVKLDPNSPECLTDPTRKAPVMTVINYGDMVIYNILKRITVVTLPKTMYTCDMVGQLIETTKILTTETVIKMIEDETGTKAVDCPVCGIIPDMGDLSEPLTAEELANVENGTPIESGYIKFTRGMCRYKKGGSPQTFTPNQKDLSIITEEAIETLASKSGNVTINCEEFGDSGFVTSLMEQWSAESKKIFEEVEEVHKGILPTTTINFNPDDRIRVKKAYLAMNDSVLELFDGEVTLEELLGLEFNTVKSLVETRLAEMSVGEESTLYHTSLKNIMEEQNHGLTKPTTQQKSDILAESARMELHNADKLDLNIDDDSDGN